MKRSASAVWSRNVHDGNRSLTHSGALDRPPTRLRAASEAPGTNPEELIAAAPPVYTMAVCAALTRGGFKPTRLSTQAVVSLEQLPGNLDDQRLAPRDARRRAEKITKQYPHRRRREGGTPGVTSPQAADHAGRAIGSGPRHPSRPRSTAVGTACTR